MKRYTNFMQKRLVPVANKFAKIPFMVVLRNSAMSTVPLMIIGAIGTFMTNIPFASIAKIVEPTGAFFGALSTVTSSVTGVVMAISIGYFSAQQYKVNPLYGIIASLSSFFAASLTSDLTINLGVFGAGGMFTAIIVGFISVYIVHLCDKHNIKIKMPTGVPPMVADSFSVIISIGLAVAFVLLIRIGLNLDINQTITNLLSPIANGLNSLPGILVYSLLSSILFMCGINPAVILGFLIPVIAVNGEANAAAVAAGMAPTGFVTWGTLTIMNAGGAGATIGLAILLLFSKAKSQKTLGKISILPSFFGINEPIIYGVPIMFNPIMVIPFIIAPMINMCLTWLLMSMDIIGRAFVEIPWTTPPIFNGFLTSGGDIRTAIWSGLVIIISALIYYPFFKISEKQELEIEVAETK